MAKEPCEEVHVVKTERNVQKTQKTKTMRCEPVRVEARNRW